jgi:hypothetical protein
MATNPKDFKVKHGLIVEGAQGTINNQTILTEVDGDAYILELIGGETLITSVSNEFDVTAGELSIDRATVDAYYDAAGDAAIVAGNLTTHETATTAIHGVTGNVVGTSDTQSLSNKTISYTDNTLTVQVANVSDLTASASELNTLDGITASTAELNLLDGVTATTAELNILDGVTATASEINLLDGVTATTAELNLLAGVTATTTELNYVDGVTSGIQGQLDDKAPLDSPALSGVPTAPTAAAGTNSTQVATTAYADAAVAAIVDGAPALLNTLNELAAAINDDENFASTLTTLAGEKVAKSGDTMTGLLVLSADPSAELGAATKQYVDAAEVDAKAYADGLAPNYDAAGAAAQALTDAEEYADGLINDASNASDEVWSAYKTNTEIGLAQQAGIDAANNLTTDDVEEGITNQYFSDALAKTSVADLLTNSTLTNITITGDRTGLVITAENGVADSDTNDLAEGTDNTGAGGANNLYFTAQRAVDALEAVVPNFTAVEINSVAKKIAATTSVATASQVTAYEFLGTEYRSAKFLVKTAQGSHTEVSEVILTLDSSNNVAITEYAIVGTGESSLMTITADYVEIGTTVRLRVTTANNTSVVTVVGTLLA